jgi:hypothetical protein
MSARAHGAITAKTVKKGSLVKQILGAALRRHAGMTALLAGLVCAPMAMAQSTAPSGSVNLEGTWKLASPQTALVPADAAKPPFTKDGLAQYEQNKKDAAKRDLSFDQTASTCSAPGLPRLMLVPGRFRLIQRERVVTMAFEWNRLFRQIDMRDVPQKRPEVDSMNGASFGQWSGDTLVVKSLGFLPDKLLDNLVSGSDTLELVEHIRLKDRDTLEDRITITDPTNFTRPWETVLTYKRQQDEPILEDNCLDRKKAGKPALPR